MPLTEDSALLGPRKKSGLIWRLRALFPDVNLYFQFEAIEVARSNGCYEVQRSPEIADRVAQTHPREDSRSISLDMRHVRA